MAFVQGWSAAARRPACLHGSASQTRSPRSRPAALFCRAAGQPATRDRSRNTLAQNTFLTKLGHSAAAAAVALALQLGAQTHVMPTAHAATSSPQNRVSFEPKATTLCDASCESKLEGLDMQNMDSGVQYKDIQVGKGPATPVGFNATVDYVAMNSKGEVVDTSLQEQDQSRTYDVRVGSDEVCHVEILGCSSGRMCAPSCQTVAGVGQGLKGMKVGGLRRLYIPGKLSYPKGFSSGPGRPNLPPRSPVVFDVQLRYVAGLDVDE